MYFAARLIQGGIICHVTSQFVLSTLLAYTARKLIYVLQKMKVAGQKLAQEKSTPVILFEAKQSYGTKPPRLMLACTNINSTHPTGT